MSTYSVLPRCLPLVALALTACGDSEATGGAGGSISVGGGGVGAGASVGGAGTGAGGVGGEAQGGSGAGGDPGPGAIGEWTDSPGMCPSGTTQRDLMTEQDLIDASRGEGAFAADGPNTCYLIHNGSYVQGGTLLLYVTRGGAPGQPIYFIGESREGVVIQGRATTTTAHVVLSNLTFDLSGYSQSGSFNTITVLDSDDITIDHVTLTGDCQTGFMGGHIEVESSTAVRAEACLIERFGQCNGDGHEDHGVYLASGSDITLENNVIRGNSSRGIQFYSPSGVLDGVTVRRNRIYDNGHRDQEDGIVLNADANNVTIERNLIYGNYFSGIRFATAATNNVLVRDNTFFQNGLSSTHPSRGELNIDDPGEAVSASIEKNIFAVGVTLLADCYDASANGWSISDNVVFGAAGSPGACVAATVSADPQFVDAANEDFHTGNPAVASYGAYAP